MFLKKFMLVQSASYDQWVLSVNSNGLFFCLNFFFFNSATCAMTVYYVLTGERYKN